MATASGLSLLAPAELDPWRTTTYGTGQLICAAVQRGARNVIVTVGGSATVDGGRGALQAIRDGGGLKGAQLVVLYDVRTPWEQSAAVYGPQKGATPEVVSKLAKRLDMFAKELPRDPRGVSSTGAAGGLAGALWSAHGAELVPGAAFVLDVLRFDDRLRRVQAVVCGEGRIDSQSSAGKIVGEIVERAHRAQVPAHAIVGRNQLTGVEARTLGLTSVTTATARLELERAADQLGRRLLEPRVPPPAAERHE